MTSHTSPEAVWQAAKSHLNSKFYDLTAPAAREAWERDRVWFRENRTSTVRIRRVKPAETWLARAMGAVDPEASLWVALIHHQRLKDRRRAVGVGIYFLKGFSGAEMHEELRAQARRLRDWYQVASRDPEEGEWFSASLGIAAVHTPAEPPEVEP